MWKGEREAKVDKKPYAFSTRDPLYLWSSCQTNPKMMHGSVENSLQSWCLWLAMGLRTKKLILLAKITNVLLKWIRELKELIID